MMCHAQGTPVMVACETYKFCERVQLDSICFNGKVQRGGARDMLSRPTHTPTHAELGNPDDLVRTDQQGATGSALADWRDVEPLKLLNLVRVLSLACPPLHVPMRASHAAARACAPDVRRDAHGVHYGGDHRGRHDPANVGAGRHPRVSKREVVSDAKVITSAGVLIAQ